MNLAYRCLPSDESFVSKFTPAFVLSFGKNFHEVGLTDFAWSTVQIFQDYKRAPVFRSGVIYSYKRSVLNKVSKWTPQLGLSASFDYQSMHLTPKAHNIHKEIYQKIFTYNAYANATIAYMISLKAFFDIDVPVVFWNAEYLYQKDILPDGQTRYIGGWARTREYFNLRLGFRYQL